VFTLLMCVFALPACSNPTPGTSVEDAASAVAAAVRGGVDAQRATTFRTNVVSAGKNCTAVTRTFFQGTDPTDGTEYWNVACDSSGDYVVMVGVGDARVMSCGDAKGVTGVDCFTAFEAK